MNKKLLTLSVLLLALATITSCGLKGPLDLPQDDEEQSSSQPSASY